MTTRPDRYSETVEEIAGHSVTLSCYSIGESCFCTVSNADPGATICRSSGRTIDQARSLALEKAKEKLAGTLISSPMSDNVLQSELNLILLNVGPDSQAFSVAEFCQLTPKERARLFLSGGLEFRDGTGETMSSGVALQQIVKFCAH